MNPVEPFAPGESRDSEGVCSPLARWMVCCLYGRAPAGVRRYLRRWVMRRERGPIYSCTVRELLARYHGVTVGMYTIGPCESEPEQFAPGTVIGRYCSVYYTVRILAEDGPSVDGWVGPAWSPGATHERKPRAPDAGVTVGHDVYIGHNAIVLPSVRSIGHGAVIGAGSVVHEDVPPYAVVTGNPARVVKYRFRPATIERLLAEQWWLKSVDELFGSGLPLQRPIEEPLTQT
ncbi:MAG: CatB-related O-acetyltransferase [Limisphaera sp.]